jgi:hypothetical protein
VIAGNKLSGRESNSNAYCSSFKGTSVLLIIEIDMCDALDVEWCAVCMQEMTGVEERDHLEDLGIDDKIILTRCEAQRC